MFPASLKLAMQIDGQIFSVRVTLARFAAWVVVYLAAKHRLREWEGNQPRGLLLVPPARRICCSFSCYLMTLSARASTLRNRDADLLRRLEIDHQLELRRLLHR